MEEFSQFIRNLGPRRISAVAGVFLVLVALLIFLLTRLSTGSTAPLFTDLTPEQASRVVTALNERGVPVETRNQGRDVLVPSANVGALRLELAGEGLGGNVLGYELFDKGDLLGASSFVQEINRTRALEGELARTVTTIDTVRGARVHIVLPRRNLYNRETQPASATVLLRMIGASRLSNGQVSSVRQLVATAVPGLEVDRISIVDDSGTLLAAGGEDTNASGGGLSDVRRVQFETALSRKIEDLLSRVVGFGKVRAEVRVEMDQREQQISEETFDPESQAVRSEIEIEDRSQANEQASATSVGTNLPGGQADGSAGNAESSQRIESRRNNEISVVRRNTLIAPGAITRISVAVLVDGSYEEFEGERTYVERDDDELAQYDRLIRSAIGFDAARGDTVEIANLQFTDEPLILDDRSVFLGLTGGEVSDLLELAVLALLGVLVLLLVVRPVLTRVLQAREAELKAQELELEAAQAALRTEIEADSVTPVADEDEDGFIDIANVQGQIRKSAVRNLSEIVSRYPDETLAVIRRWIYQGR